jgi:hypothetical protein
LQNIVKKNRFDLPPGIENVASDWGLVKSRGEYHLTQVRATCKKFVCISLLIRVTATDILCLSFLRPALCRSHAAIQLKNSMPEGPSSGHTNIFALGQRFVKDTETTLTVELCARIALMVCSIPPAQFYELKFDYRDNNTSFIQVMISGINSTPNLLGCANKLATTSTRLPSTSLLATRIIIVADHSKFYRAFKQVLADDRASHGKSAEYTLPEDAVVDAWQASVDTSIDTDGPDA